MARLTVDRPTARAAVGVPSDDRWIGPGLVAALVVLALLRVALGGWAPLAPDDARYLYVGLSILDGHGPVTPSGSTFLLRSPVYGLTLATGSSLVGGDPLIGARLVALGLSLLALAGAVRLGWLLAGPGGAIGTAFALVAAALVWRLVPSLRIDLPQTAAIVATLLAVRRPTTRRWALGGVLLGLAILVKETALPLLILPVAFLGTVPPSRLARLAAVFAGAAVLTAGWWWLVVWLSTGQVFPLNALSVIEARDVDVALRVDRSTAVLLALAIAGWGLVAWRALRKPDTGARLLMVAAVALAPAASYAARLGLDARNFAGLAVLSAVAVGAGGAWLVADVRGRRATGSAGQRRLATLTLVGVAAVALAAPVVGQRDAGRMAPDRIGDDLAAWLVANVPENGRVAMAFREREQMALRLYGRADVAILPIARVDASEPLGDYLWMGLRDRQLFGYRRAAWEGTLGGDLGGAGGPADLLVLVGPHPFTPRALTSTAETLAGLGLSPAATLEAGGDEAQIYRLDAGGARTSEVPLHLSADAAGAWLDLAGDDTATGRLLDARPVVDGDPAAIDALVRRLGTTTCATTATEGSVALGRPGTCPD